MIFMEAIYPLIKDKTNAAIRNAEQLEKRAKEKGYIPNTADFSPSTDDYRIFQLLTAPTSKQMGFR